VAQGEGPEFKPQYHKKKEKKVSWVAGQPNPLVASRQHKVLRIRGIRVVGQESGRGGQV
jgi:hypothetical protein